MKRLLIRDGHIVTMNQQKEIMKGDLLIENDRITAIAPRLNVDDCEVLEAGGMTVIPGFIQTHIHLTQTLLRGQADDLELLDWLKKRVWPLEGSHTAESNYVSAKLGIAELIKGGTTAIIDMETVHHTESAFEALLETGYRAISGKCMMDYGNGVPASLMEKTSDSINESLRLMKKWHGTGGGRIDYAFAPRFVVSCTEELLVQVKDLAAEYGVMVHTHASENRGEIELVQRDRGMRNIQYLKHLGLTGENLILAHCIWLDEEEMQILADTGTKIAHCPSSNMKLASGIAKIPELMEMNAQVSLAADGAPCNNNLDMFREMRHAALIQKARLLSPTVMPAATIFEMATMGGARAMGKERELGSLEPGKKADVVLVKMDTLHNAPWESGDPVSQLVYSATAADVDTTIINGEILMKNRQLTTINEAALKDEANRLIKERITTAGVVK
ncbi:5'-deoxyadenosine deaminase [Anoxynatronum buryatiense]|uniref:5-methylthioadenosine/S-adenosylhomocysteine deaminase n=1 Tax=Anoxynatronum buryatiense TaxID=489973 RepID=A0AA46AI08_9CLOT|nr:5'-deoxyadenosine deaminase [Anoxynatronum buryatiense]SMP44386.1 5-methylthioadenosine/S-adenosylhomocysteine deaminase [Anoxynatronum buryatiense]